MIAALAATLLVLGWLPRAAAQTGERTLLLVARPGLPDRNFRRAVVLVTQGEDGQSIGVIINRPTDQSLAAILPGDRFKRFTEPVFFGGPVAPHALLAVFRTQRIFAGSLPLLPGLYLALNGSTLDELLQSPPQDIRWYVGYSGWGPGQLRAELDRGDWYALKADPDTVFSADTAGLWARLLGQARSVSAMSETAASAGTLQARSQPRRAAD